MAFFVVYLMAHSLIVAISPIDLVKGQVKVTGGVRLCVKSSLGICGRGKTSDEDEECE